MTPTRRLNQIWAVLSVITIVTWLLAHADNHRAGATATAVTIVVVVIAFTKARLIVRYFMEVRSAPRWLKTFTDIWLLALAGPVLALYLW